MNIIENNEGLKELIKSIKPTDTVYIDLECENNMHQYGVFCCLIQVEHEGTHIIDTLKVSKKIISELFMHPCQKVFHDITFDFRVIQNEYGCVPINHLDTQLAAMMVGETKLGFGSLVEKYLKVTLDKHGQRANWSKRPINKKLLEYAANDVKYLKPLLDCLLTKLNERVEWLKEECAYRETLDWPLHTPHWNDLKNLRSLTEKQLYKAQMLWYKRETLAQKLDKPVYMVISNKNIIKCALGQRVPAHPKFREFLSLKPVEGEPLPIRDTKRYNIQEYKELRDQKSVEQNVSPDILFPLHDMRLLHDGKNMLRNWQKKILYP